MDLSSNSLIHLTRKKSKFKAIFKEGFIYGCCHEQVFTSGRNKIGYFIPMVCFSDIPISRLKNHIKAYGSYGIGLSKEWGRKRGLNPVLYIENKSALGAQLHSGFYQKVYGKNLKTLPKSDLDLIEVIRYLKNYEGDLGRENRKTIKNYRFSDEREWRQVVSRDEDFEMFLDMPAYIKQSTASMIHAKGIIDKLRLEFNPEDINYIIVNKESEISSLIRFLQRTYRKSPNVDRLLTRIITTEQIRDDF